MNLTREQAIAEHRKMWNCMADYIERIKSIINVYGFKKQYCKNEGYEKIINWCFLCEYTKESCIMCPLEWDSKLRIPCEGDITSSNNKSWGLWLKCQKAETWQEQAALARKIANLPEREDV